MEEAPNYKWYILALAAATFAVVIGIPTMSLPVLFPEIADDLGLTIVQVGGIWGIGNLMGIVMGLVGGTLGDRFGPRNTLIFGCLLVGITGALRGIADGFVSLMVTTIIFGIVLPVIPMNIHKICGVWFSGKRLGLANGIVSVGIALGFTLGALLAASFFSPLLGGWRNVVYLYGGIAIVVSILWALTREKKASATQGTVSFRQGLLHVSKLRNVWLIAIASMGITACVQGMLGYLPTYLRNTGWLAVDADNALASFHFVSMLAAIPIALLSDRLGIRRGMLMVGGLLIAGGTGLLWLVTGPTVWVVVMLAGLMRDGYMAILMTTAMEVRGVGARYAGTATGLVMVFLGLGNVISPPIGNYLERLSPSLPFLFWALLAVCGVVGFLFVKNESSDIAEE